MGEAATTQEEPKLLRTGSCAGSGSCSSGGSRSHSPCTTIWLSSMTASAGLSQPELEITSTIARSRRTASSTRWYSVTTWRTLRQVTSSISARARSRSAATRSRRAATP